MNAQQTYHLKTKPRCVIADGPYETEDQGFEYCVTFGDQEGEPICDDPKAIWYLWDYDEVCRFSRELAHKFHLELVFEASPA